MAVFCGLAMSVRVSISCSEKLTDSDVTDRSVNPPARKHERLSVRYKSPSEVMDTLTDKVMDTHQPSSR